MGYKCASIYEYQKSQKYLKISSFEAFIIEEIAFRCGILYHRFFKNEKSVVFEV